MSVYYQDDTVTLYHGDAHTVLNGMGSGSVSTIVTSPPYYGLRDYGDPNQLGAEDTPAEYVDRLVRTVCEASRCLTDDGTLWLNLGDSYSTHRRGSDNGWDASRLSNPARVQKMQSAAMRGRTFDRPEKNLLGIPWRVAFALQDAGLILRNEVIWVKPNGMPESVTDRLTSKHEHLFLFSKQADYFFNLDAIREPHALRPERRPAGCPDDATSRQGQAKQSCPTARRWEAGVDGHPLGRNPGDVWSIPTQPFTGAHFAAMPLALADRCVRAGCPEGGTVLDLFSGSGTTGLAAARHGARYVGIDLIPGYLDLSLRTRLAQGALDLFPVGGERR